LCIEAGIEINLGTGSCNHAKDGLVHERVGAVQRGAVFISVIAVFEALWDLHGDLLTFFPLLGQLAGDALL
jgi:hypothetical protein